MAVYKPQLTVVQMVREAAKGTLIAATRKTAFESFKVTPIDLLHRPNLVKGMYIANKGNEFAIKRGVEWAVSGPVLYDQFHSWLDMAVNGAVAAPTGAADPYTWTMTRNATADPALKSKTFEYFPTDGTVVTGFKFGYAMATKLEISAAENEPVMFSIEGFARRLQVMATKTAALALPAIAIPPIALTKLYIDSTWATLGTTIVTGQLLGWKWTVETGEMPVYTADVRADLDFPLDEMNIENAKVSAEILLLVTGSGQWATEKTAAEAGTLRAVRLVADIGTTPARTLTLDALMKHTPGSILPDGEKDGLQTITLRLEGATDDTNFISAAVLNSIATWALS